MFQTQVRHILSKDVVHQYAVRMGLEGGCDLAEPCIEADWQDAEDHVLI